MKTHDLHILKALPLEAIGSAGESWLYPDTTQTILIGEETIGARLLGLCRGLLSIVARTWDALRFIGHVMTRDPDAVETSGSLPVPSPVSILSSTTLKLFRKASRRSLPSLRPEPEMSVYSD
jgi:hypothetical protein